MVLKFGFDNSLRGIYDGHNGNAHVTVYCVEHIDIHIVLTAFKIRVAERGFTYQNFIDKKRGEFSPLFYLCFQFFFAAS